MLCANSYYGFPYFNISAMAPFIWAIVGQTSLFKCATYWKVFVSLLFLWLAVISVVLISPLLCAEWNRTIYFLKLGPISEQLYKHLKVQL